MFGEDIYMPNTNDVYFAIFFKTLNQGVVKRRPNKKDAPSDTPETHKFSIETPQRRPKYALDVSKMPNAPIRTYLNHPLHWTVFSAAKIQC